MAVIQQLIMATGEKKEGDILFRSDAISQIKRKWKQLKMKSKNTVQTGDTWTS